MKSEYFFLNLCIFLGPLLVTFLCKRCQKVKMEPAFFAIVIPAVFFILWDELVTGLFWYFNPSYILGINLFKIPFEEALFFFIVPFACLLLWVNFQKLHVAEGDIRIGKKWFVVIPLFLCFSSFYFLFKGLLYPFSILFVFACVMVLDIMLKTNLFRNKKFLGFLALINLFTLIFNYYATARPIVTYNALVKTNIMILTIPIEDFLYGLCLISLNIILYERAKMKRTYHFFKRALISILKVSNRS